MAIMYLAKVNFNSLIYEIYNKKLDLNCILNSLFENINDKDIFITQSNEPYIDSLGNARKYVRKSQYQFSELEKNGENGAMIITGKMTRTFTKLTEYVDTVTNSVRERYNEEGISIYFYFDVKNELITFCERQTFGYNQFMRAFSYLINKCVGKYNFEVFLQKDKDMLSEKIGELRTVRRVRATLIPPNSTDEDLAELRQSLAFMSDIQDINATTYTLDAAVSSDEQSIRMDSKYMQDVMLAITKGYGDMTTYGRNNAGREQIVKSNQDAALTRVIDDRLNQEDFKDEAKGFITSFLAKQIIKIIG